MKLFAVLLLPLLGSVVPLYAARFSRTKCAILTALAPAIALGIVLSVSPQLLQGEVIAHAVSWVPAAGLDLSVRLDGLAFLFLLLILGIGLLIILYARYYLSKQDSMGRFFAYLMLFMTAIVGVVAS